MKYPGIFEGAGQYRYRKCGNVSLPYADGACGYRSAGTADYEISGLLFSPAGGGRVDDRNYCGGQGELNGLFLFLLDETFTREVLDTVLGEEERNLLSLDEMERSLICELGNIMCGSYICALSGVLDLKMEVTVPSMSIDMGLAILSVPVAHYSRVSEDILVIDNIFRMGGKAFSGRILFLPEPEALEMMLQRLRE